MVSRGAPNMAGTNRGSGNPLSQSQSVLVADDADNFMAARPTTGFLPLAANFTPSAEHGPEAIVWLRRVPPDRMLLKARMPELNGLPAVQLPQCDTRTTHPGHHRYSQEGLAGSSSPQLCCGQGSSDPRGTRFQPC
jgi:hypothetical protein